VIEEVMDNETGGEVMHLLNFTKAHRKEGKDFGCAV
jgi:hypothetical protein